MLGGVRAMPEAQSLTVDLIRGQIEQLRQHMPGGHIQAAIELADESTQSLIESSGLSKLAEVDQLWLNLDGWPLSESSGHRETLRSLACQHASVLSRWRFQQLLSQTFEGTLDCPELNGIRSARDVLESFLSGRRLRECQYWSTLWQANELVGCLMLQAHNHNLIELAYMGLIPSARGRGLGVQILEFATKQARDLQASMIVVAADSRNVPAQNLYRKFGFQFHRRLRVYWAGHAVQAD